MEIIFRTPEASDSNAQFVQRLKVLAALAGGASSLAKTCGVSESAVRKYFQGSEPTRPVITAMANGLGVRVGWLVDGSGTMCKPDSPIITRARFAIGAALQDVLGLPEYRECGTVGGARIFADEYQQRIERFPVATWVRLAIPKLTFDEANAWRLGKLDYVASESKDDAIIQANPKTVAMVAASIRRKFGKSISELSTEKESHLFAIACAQFEKFGEDGMPDIVLDDYIQFLAFEFDKAGVQD